MSATRSPEPPFYPPTSIPGPPWEGLVKEGWLRRADVVLTHGKKGFISWLIRRITRSYWNHAALVYVIRKPSEGYENTFVIESEGQGIDIHNISKYLENTKNDIAIKRLDADWFSNPGEQPGGGVWYQRQVRGLALDEIDASYDFGRLVLIGLGIVGPHLLQALLLLLLLGALLPWLFAPGPAWLLALGGSLLALALGALGILTVLEGLFWLWRRGGLGLAGLGGVAWVLALGQLWLWAWGDPLGQGLLGLFLWFLALGGLLLLTRGESPWASSLEGLLWPLPLVVGRGGRGVPRVPPRLKRVLQDSFICSGFVQYAYYHAIYDAMHGRGAVPAARDKLEAVCFNPELEGMTPGDAQWDEVLRSTTPADLERSRRLRWRYLVQDGRLWEIGVPPHVVAEWQLTPPQVITIEELQVKAIVQGQVQRDA